LVLVQSEIDGNGAFSNCTGFRGRGLRLLLSRLQAAFPKGYQTGRFTPGLRATNIKARFNGLKVEGFSRGNQCG
jgi:hypothetical protein